MTVFQNSLAVFKIYSLRYAHYRFSVLTSNEFWNTIYVYDILLLSSREGSKLG